VGGTVTRNATASGWSEADAVAWHELECGGYAADLELWHELAAAEGDPVLDVGAGSGRVALALARAGHEVVALDHDPALLAALEAQARGMSVSTVCADARELALGRQFALCIVPMQTIQLLGGAAGRASFLKRARAHLRLGGLLAAALLPEAFDEFDAAAGDAPDPERLRRGELRYASQPTALRIEPGAIVIERQRERRAPGMPARRSMDVVRLDRVSDEQLAAEATGLGFRPERPRAVAATSDHVGSEVVLLRA
jgi:SAM-dependent methyltransferase